MTTALSREAMTTASSRTALPRLLSLFDGTGSISKPFADAGWETQRLDINGRYGATIVRDIRDWDYSEEPAPDVIFAAPPCEAFSVARSTAKTPRDYALADELVRVAWAIIAHFGRKNENLLWFIENPATSHLWKRAVAAPFPHRVILDYCQYSSPGYRKRTRFATNSAFHPRPLCDPRTCPSCVDGRHILSAQQGPSKGNDGRRDPRDIVSLATLHAYPAELCMAIFEFCHGVFRYPE